MGGGRRHNKKDIRDKIRERGNKKEGGEKRKKYILYIHKFRLIYTTTIILSSRFFFEKLEKFNHILYKCKRMWDIV